MGLLDRVNQALRIGQRFTSYLANPLVAGIQDLAGTKTGQSMITNAAQSIPRAGARVGFSLTGNTAALQQSVSPTETSVAARVQRALFGSTPIGTFSQYGKETAQGFGIKAKLPTAVAAPIGLGLTALDINPFSSGEKGITEEVLQKLSKLSNAEQIANILKTLVKDIPKSKITSIAEELSKVSKVDEVKKILQSSIVAPAAKVERGFITSIKENLPALDRVAGQYIPRSTDTLATKAANLVREDIATAEKIVRTKTDDTAVATASELLKHYASEAQTATSDAVRNAIYDKAASVATTIASKLTESGRSVQAASILGRLTPEGQVRFAASEIMRYNEGKSLAKQIPDLTGEQTKFILDEMHGIGTMPDGIDKAMRFQKLQNYVSDLVPTPLFKKIITVWKAGLLTGLKTTGVNVLANLSHAGSELISRAPATMVDSIASIFTGKRTTAFTTKGLGTGAQEGIAKGLQYFKTGFDERNIGTKLDFKRVNFGDGPLAKGLQAYTDTVFHVLGAEDQPFYYAAKLRSIYEQAKVGAINAGLKGSKAQSYINDIVNNPTEDIIKNATLDAESAVFQNKTVLSDIARSIQKAGGGAGEIVVPFGRTPSAVAMQIFNYSPAGAVATIVRNIGKGKFDQRDLATGLGRAVTGTAMLAAGAELFKKGNISLARPTGEKEQKLWELEGRQANSVLVNGKWRQVQTLGPLGPILLIGAYTQKNFSQLGSPTDALAKTLAGASQSFTQQTFLTGVSNFIDALSDPARSAASVVGSTIASSVPTLVADLARATDSTERRANTIKEKVMARIPGVRESLQPQVTTLGQTKQTTGNPAEIMAAPTRPSPVQSSPVISELRRLWDAGQQVSPTLLGDKAGYAILTPEQNTQLWQHSGQIVNQKLDALFKLPQYQQMADDEKGKTVQNIIDKSKVSARAAMVVELTKGLTGTDLKNKLAELKKSGLMTVDVFKLYQQIK